VECAALAAHNQARQYGGAYKKMNTFQEFVMSSLSVLRRTSRSATALVTAIALAVSGCGGDANFGALLTKPAVKPLPLTKSVFASGESISLNGIAAPATSAALTFADGQRYALPLMPDGSVLVPVISSAQAGQAVSLSVLTAQGEYRAAGIRLQQIAVGTSKPGVATLVYLEASIAHLDSAIDEMVTLAEATQVPEAEELLAMRGSLEQLHVAVASVQAGTPVELSAPGAAQKVLIDSEQLAVLDQYIMALLKTTSRADPGIARANGTVLLAAATASPIPTVDCVAIIGTSTTQEDQAFCANLRVQLTSDVLIHYTGMVGTAGALIAASLAALTALGVVSLAGTAALIGAVSVAMIVAANAIGIALQGASAYGTGSPKGIDIRENVKNLIDTARSLVVGQLTKLFPDGGSALVKQLIAAISALVSSKLFDIYDQFVARLTKAVGNCVAQANSGGQGSFARRYDFGNARSLRLAYNAYDVPDQFSVSDGSGDIGGTGGLVSGAGTLALTTTSNFVTVKVNAPRAGTAWTYSLSCAN
jgi:hypothetical protein